jgi:hypothetical protein
MGERFLLRCSYQIRASTHEIEAGLMDEGGFLPLSISTKEDRRPKESLEHWHEATILSATLLHSEGVEHFGRTAKPDHSGLLADRERRKENRDIPSTLDVMQTGLIGGGGQGREVVSGDIPSSLRM